MNKEHLYLATIIILLLAWSVLIIIHFDARSEINSQQQKIANLTADVKELEGNITLLENKSALLVDYGNSLIQNNNWYHNYTIDITQEAQHFLAGYYCLYDFYKKDFVSVDAADRMGDCHNAALKGQYNLVEEYLSYDSYTRYIVWQEYFTHPFDFSEIPKPIENQQ